MDIGIGIAIPVFEEAFDSLPLGATLDLDLTNPATAALLTTTRASLAWADDSAGNWSQFANNVPRITNKGILIEEARTNSIRNNSMQGAAAGTPGTLPTNWVIAPAGQRGLALSLALGNSKGIDYIDITLSGSPTSTGAINLTLELGTIIAASVGQAWSGSIFAAIVAGSAAGFVVVTLNTACYDAGSVYLGEAATPTPLAAAPATLTRFSHLATALAATASLIPYVQLSVTNGVPVNITLRLGWPQLELGAFVTSPIRTTSVAVQRNADVISAALPGGATAATLFVEATRGGSGNTINVQADNGGANDRIFLWNNANVLSGNVRNGGADTSTQTLNTTAALGATFKQAMAVAANDASYTDGGIAPGADLTVTFPATATRLSLGNNGVGSAQPNGYLRRVAYWPTRLTNAELQSMTA